VDAEINADGGVSICSGDGNAEWYAVIDRTAKTALLEARRKHLNYSNLSAPGTDEDILDLLVRVFSGGPGPHPGLFGEITHFLDANGVRWQSDFWGSL
jgi:hypothetical protein